MQGSNKESFSAFLYSFLQPYYVVGILQQPVRTA